MNTDSNTTTNDIMGLFIVLDGVYTLLHTTWESYQPIFSHQLAEDSGSYNFRWRLV